MRTKIVLRIMKIATEINVTLNANIISLVVRNYKIVVKFKNNHNT